MSEIFLISAEQTLIPLVERAYASEDLLQALLEKYPSLLAGDQINPQTPRRWLLVKREAAVPGEVDGAGRWSLDHLFLDQDGIPTLVEVKRSTDTRIRREVVGQMLDYAANGVRYWPIEALRSHYEETCEAAGFDPDEKIAELVGGNGTAEQFWVTVKTNLQAGRIRMLFVADEIPEELRRVVEFLNEQMDPAEVLAVEIKQFTGASMKTLVPRVIGQTSEASERKRVSSGRAKRQWDEASILSEMETRHGPEALAITERLFAWSKSSATRIYFGQGAYNGSFSPVVDHKDNGFWPFFVYLDGAKSQPCIEINFQHNSKRAPFDNRALRLEWLRRLNQIPGIVLNENVIERRPSVPLRLLATESAMTLFSAAMAWYFSEVRKG